MTKILITGGAGFIGTALIGELIEQAFDIVVYDNLSRSNIQNISPWLGKSKFRFINADMLDSVSLSKAIDKCEIVFHLAANPDVRLGSNDTRVDFDQNIVATYNLLDAMRKSSNCKKIVFASSSTVYGEPDLMPTREDYSPLEPISLYGSSKLACESIISGYCHMFDMSGVVLRLANVVGPNSTHGVTYDLIMKLVRDSKNLEILGNGQQDKSYVFIEDCIAAFNLAAFFVSDNTSTFNVFNAGSLDTIRVSEIAKIVMEEMSVRDVKLRFAGGRNGRSWSGDVKEMLLDSSKLISCGWRPKYGSREAIVRSARGIVDKLQVVRTGKRGK